MKDNVDISSFFDGLTDIFNPVVAYKGNYVFRSDVLSLVSKKENGKNLVEEFLDKKYYKSIKSILSQMSFIRNPKLYFVSDLAGDYGRDLKMSLDLFITEISYILTGEPFILSGNKETLREETLNYFRNYRKQINEIQNGNINSDNKKTYDTLMSDYVDNEKHRAMSLGKQYRPMIFDKYLQVKKDYITNFLIGLRYLIPLFDKPIDLNELEECLDLEKFYLAMAKQLIDVTHITLKTENAVHNSFVYVARYVSIVREMFENNKYNLKIDTITLEGKKIKYSVEDAIREYNQIILDNPEFSIHVLVDDGKDYRDMNVVEDVTSEIEEYVESKKLEASWEFIRNSKKEENELSDEVIDRIKKGNSKKKITRDERVQMVLDRMSFLENTDYLYKITGKNNFEGYIGYIYQNGTVIFERLYKNKNSKEPSYSNATYVMTFNNFVEMSKLTKTDIIKYIKFGGTDVKRVYHTSKWCDKIIQIIKGKAYDEKAMEKIDRLIKDGEISKKKSNN